MRKKLDGLKMAKLDDRIISKIIDLMPETSEELNKVVFGITLEEDETKKILDIVKEFK
jgi:DNA-directed RNA polymerase subunit F